MGKESRMNSYPMQQLAPIICEFLELGKDVIVPARGNSMRPLVRDIKDSIVLTAYKGEPLSAGDAVFYRRDNGIYVLHRIVALQAGGFTLMGDNQGIPEEGIRAEQIIAVPTAFIRRNKTVSCSSSGYKRYVRFWTKSIFFRKLHHRLFYLWVRIKIKLKRMLSGI